MGEVSVWGFRNVSKGMEHKIGAERRPHDQLRWQPRLEVGFQRDLLALLTFEAELQAKKKVQRIAFCSPLNLGSHFAKYQKSVIDP